MARVIPNARGAHIDKVTRMQTARWTRYGKDRLYVKGDDGVDVGWWDLSADEGHPARSDLLSALTLAVTEWRTAAETPGDAARQTSSAATGTDSTGWSRPVARSAPQPRASGPDAAPPLGPESTDVSGRNPPSHLEVVTPLAQFPPPVGPPVVADLLANRPGEQLEPHIEAARQAGQRATFLRTLFLGKNAVSTWERGAIGEELVAEQLTRLRSIDPRWAFINSIPVGSNGADIDHLLIGPGGVFSINAKYHPGATMWVAGDTVMVNGARYPYIRNSRHEARRASKALGRAVRSPVPVQGIVVPVRASRLTVRERPADVWIVPRNQLVRVLRALPLVLPTHHVQSLVDAARLSSTWTG